MTALGDTGQGPERPELAGLQYLRGLAACGVIFVHISTMMAKEKYLGHQPFGGLLEHGRFGVDLFFALSGFIMVYIALSADLSPRTRPAAFLWSRFTRIAPFLWVIVVIFAVLRWTTRGVFVAEDYLRAVTFFPIGQVAPTQAWTLRHELLFYLVFAGTFLAWKPLRSVAVLWVLASALAPVWIKEIGPGIWRELAWFAFHPLNLLFAGGALAGWVFLRFAGGWRAPGWTAPLLLPLAIGLTGAAAMIGYDRSGTAELVMVAVLLGALLIFAAALPPSAHGLARLAKLLGDASYSIYLTHGIFLAGALGVLAKAPAIPDAAVVAGIFLLCVAGGVAAHFAIERPVLAFVRGRLQRRKAAIDPAAQ